MTHKTITLGDGLMVIEGDVSQTGVTYDMVKNIRQAYSLLNDLVRNSEPFATEDGPEPTEEQKADLHASWHQAHSLLKYLRKTAQIERNQGDN